MNKEDFLNELRKKLSGLPQDDLEERLSFYSEMIDDRVEDGKSQEEAVADIGTVDSVVEQIMADTPLALLVKERVRPKRDLKAWEVLLLILGSPVWVPLIMAFVIIVLSVYVVIWSVVICFYALDLSLLAGFIGCIVGIFMYIGAKNAAGVLFSIGAAFICAGLAILMFFACVWITKAVVRLTGKMLLGMKTRIVGK